MYAVEPALVRANSEKLTSAEIVERLAALPKGPEWVTLSGGNPAMLKLDEFVRDLHRDWFKVAVETQGSIWREWLGEVDCLTISPKPPSSGMAAKTAADLPAFMHSASVVRVPRSRDALKIVVFDEADFAWAVDVFEAWPTWPRFLSCGTDRPAADETDADTLLRLSDRYRWLCEAVASSERLRGVRVLPQLHVIAWSHARGV